MNKKAAMELSVSTIVIIVLAMTMLILGMVLVRSIMCGAVGLTDDINSKIRGQINNLFESTGDEIACIGSGEAVSIIPGQTNYFYCSVNADKEAEYYIQVKSLKGNTLTEQDLQEWVVGENFFRQKIAPGDVDPRKFLRLNVPNNAPEDAVMIQIEIYKDGTLIKSPTLDFQIKRQGVFTSAIC